MSRQTVDEYQIAQLLKDFTRSALLSQPENLVEFARQYFNDMDASKYTKVEVHAPLQTPNSPKQDMNTSRFTLESLGELYNKLYELDIDHVQDLERIKETCESVGTWNSQMKELVDSKADELSKSLIFLMACSVDSENRRKNFVDSLKTVFEAVGDKNGTTLEIQQIIDYFADLALFHDEIDSILADQVVQYLLGQGFVDTDAEITNKFDGNSAITFEQLITAPCLQEWLSSKSSAS